MAVTPVLPAAAGEHNEPEKRRWTVAEFERFIDLGVFGPEERLELIDGEIIRKVTQREPYSAGITLTGDTLRVVFATGHHIRVQMPLRFGNENGDRPEPDVAVVQGGPRDYLKSHPDTAVLVVEVSDTTLDYDRTTKAGTYARAGIAEYWIVNLPDRVLEVYRQPGPMSGYPLGHYFGSVTRYAATEAVAPLAAPQSPVKVAGLLP